MDFSRSRQGGKRMKASRMHSSKRALIVAPLVVAIFSIFLISHSVDWPGNTWAQSAKEGRPQPNIFTAHEQPIGAVDPEGNIYALHGNLIGKVTGDGLIYNVSNTLIGKVDSDGQVLNQSGTVLCRVKPDGTVINVSGILLGSVKETGDNMNLIGGAARLLLLRKK
jgi:5-fold beta-flower protein